jgi:hypothetical protein
MILLIFYKLLCIPTPRWPRLSYRTDTLVFLVLSILAVKYLHVLAHIAVNTRESIREKRAASRDAFE